MVVGGFGRAKQDATNANEHSTNAPVNA